MLSCPIPFEPNDRRDLRPSPELQIRSNSNHPKFLSSYIYFSLQHRQTILKSSKQFKEITWSVKSTDFRNNKI